MYNIYLIENWITKESFIYYSTSKSGLQIVRNLYKKKLDIYNKINSAIDEHGINNFAIRFLELNVDKEDVNNRLITYYREHKPVYNEGLKVKRNFRSSKAPGKDIINQTKPIETIIKEMKLNMIKDPGASQKKIIYIGSSYYGEDNNIKTVIKMLSSSIKDKKVYELMSYSSLSHLINILLHGKTEEDFLKDEKENKYFYYLYKSYKDTIETSSCYNNEIFVIKIYPETEKSKIKEMEMFNVLSKRF
jgi:hypothetical protein